MVDRKLDYIRSNPVLDSVVHKTASYNLIGCDLRHVEDLGMKLAECGIDSCAPTLFIAECVLTYVDVQR